MENIRFSKSAIENFIRCPRCFHLEKVEGIKQPQGIRSGLPMGMDRVLKAHYDAYRAAGNMPPELLDALPGWKLYDGKRISMTDLRNWRKGLFVQVGDHVLSTALDDLLFNPALCVYSMVDYKTKAKATNEAATVKYYQTQADAYDLALNVNGYKTDGLARFTYYYPENVVLSAIATGELSMNWRCQVITIKADHERIKKLVLAAAACLAGPLPEPSESCEMCAYIEARGKLYADIAKAETKP